MLDAIIASRIIILSFSKTLHRCILHSTQSNCCSALAHIPVSYLVLTVH